MQRPEVLLQTARHLRVVAPRSLKVDHVTQAGSLELTETQARHMLETMEACVFEFDVSSVRSKLIAIPILDEDAFQAWVEDRPQALGWLLEDVKATAVNELAVKLFDAGDASDLRNFFQRCWTAKSAEFWAKGILSAMAGAPAVTGKTTLRTLHGREFGAFATIFYPPALFVQNRVLMGLIDLSPDERWQATLRASEAFYQDMFNAPSVAAWHLDASAAREMYANLKKAGVVDIRSYAEDHPDFIAEALGKLVVVDINETTVKLFGASHRDQIVGGSVLPFWIPGQYETALGSIAASYNDEPSFRADTRMQTLDGRQIDVLFTVSASPQLRAAGQALVGIVDVTDRVRAESALAEMEANFVHSARVSLLGELTASIAHEINQPLAAITTYGETSLRWLDRPEPNLVEVRRLATRMIEDARRASDIIKRIRAMAVPTVLPDTPLVVNSVVRDAMRFLHPETRRAGVAVALRLAVDLPGIVGDAIQLQQVLVNLAVNAVQAMSASARPRLLIRTSAVEADAVRIEVIDTGPGIPPENFDRLFDSFFTTKDLGMGIGLSICRSIVEAHGGSIAIDNVGSGGARATLILPASIEPPSQEANIDPLPRA